MRRVRFAACCVGLAVCLVTVGCGGGAGTTAGGGAAAAGPARTEGGAGGDTARAASTEGDAGSREAGAERSTAPDGRREAIHEPVQSRGIKGEDPSTEAATRLHISTADCAALGRLAERRLGVSLSRQSDPTPPLSHCHLSGHGTSIAIYLDTGFAAHQRYANRIEETVQFNEQHPAGLPHPVPHVGEKAAYDADANWIPALRSLLALRGNRWLTVTISVAGHADRELRDEAAVLARAGFKLTAGG